MSYTGNTPARNLSVDLLPRTSQTGSIAYVNDALGAQKYYVDNQSMAYHKDGEWLKFQDNLEVIPNAPSLWNTECVFNDWNPDTGAFNLSSISISDSSNNYGGSGDGIYRWRGFIDMPINNQTIKVFFSYQIKDSLRGGSPVAAIIQSHGWGSTYGEYSASSSYLSNDFAVISYDWAGTYNGTYSYPSKLMTIYPSALSGLNQVTNPGADSRQNTVTDIASIKTMDMYYWSAIPRRLLSYVRTISDIDENKIGFSGYSWGGTLAWNMCTDDRLKAIVSFYGVGWITYWRGANPKYIIPYSETTYSDATNRYISALESQSYAKRAKVPILWLTGTNEYHGRLDRGQDSFTYLPSYVNGSFAWEANQAHNSQENTIQNEILWFKKYLKGENITWYESVDPIPSLVSSTYSTSGYPMVTITPDASANVVSLSGWYANYQPDETSRLWLSGSVVNNGNGTWSFEMPSDDVTKWNHAYALIKYDNNVAICTKVASFIPTDLGDARNRIGAYFDPLKATSATLNLWLDANDPSTFTLGTNNKVVQWNDKSSFATHAVNSTDVSRPTLSAITEGINAVTFKSTAFGSTGLLSNTVETKGSYRDLFIVTKYNRGTKWNVEDGISYITLFSGGVNLGTGSNGIVGSPNTSFCPLSTEFWNASWIQDADYYLNGSLTPVVSSGTNDPRIALPTISNNAGIVNFRYTVGTLTLSGYTISGLKGSIGNSWYGNIYEIVSYQTLLNKDERQKVEGYLAYKWGLQNLLPSAHPYKNTRPPS